MGAVEFVKRIVLGIWESRDICNFEAQSFRSLEPGARDFGGLPSAATGVICTIALLPSKRLAIVKRA